MPKTMMALVILWNHDIRTCEWTLGVGFSIVATPLIKTLIATCRVWCATQANTRSLVHTTWALAIDLAQVPPASAFVISLCKLLPSQKKLWIPQAPCLSSFNKMPGGWCSQAPCLSNVLAPRKNGWHQVLPWSSDEQEGTDYVRQSRCDTKCSWLCENIRCHQPICRCDVPEQFFPTFNFIVPAMSKPFIFKGAPFIICLADWGTLSCFFITVLSWIWVPSSKVYNNAHHLWTINFTIAEWE